MSADNTTKSALNHHKTWAFYLSHTFYSAVQKQIVANQNGAVIFQDIIILVAVNDIQNKSLDLQNICLCTEQYHVVFINT